MGEHGWQSRQADRPGPPAEGVRATGPRQTQLAALSTMLNAAAPVQRLATMPPGNRAGTPDALKAEKIQPLQTEADGKHRPTVVGGVVQRAKKWNKARVKRYQRHLERRVHHRLKRNKTKPVNKLVRKLRNARLRAGLGDFSLADAPKSGHHAPPLALSNKAKSVYRYGRRNSAKEKRKPRLYLAGSSKRRRTAHGTLHAAEALLGLDRSKGFSGSDRNLVKRQLLAHHGLSAGKSGRAIKVAAQSRTDRDAGVALPKFKRLAKVTPRLYRQHGAPKKHTKLKFEKDSTDSEPDSDFENRDSDSEPDSSSSDSESD